MGHAAHGKIFPGGTHMNHHHGGDHGRIVIFNENGLKSIGKTERCCLEIRAETRTDSRQRKKQKKSREKNYGKKF